MNPEVKKEFKNSRKFTFALTAGLFFLILHPAAAAEITLPSIEMASRGRMNNGAFVVSSYISADIALTGGYKYALLLGLSIEAEDILRTNYPGLPVFRIAQATARNIFGLPLELSYFIGSGDAFCTGDEISKRFGLSPFGTEFKGFLYFPESIRYDGIHRAQGTGFTLGLTKSDYFAPIL